MRPFELLGSATTPDGRRLTFHRRDGDFFLYLDGDELMSSRAPGSESALAELACRELATTQAPRILIGGLGLGYTLRVALDRLSSRAEIVVAEVFPSVVEWNRTYLSALVPGCPNPLSDARVQVVEKDVFALLDDSSCGPGGSRFFDAILLDVDNGPSAWCLDSNRRLYDRVGLEKIRQRLRPSGVLAVWSAHRDDRFVDRLRAAGFSVRTETVRARGRRGSQHTIFLGRAG